MARIDKDNYYLNIAETLLQRGTCLRVNQGAVIVNNDEIVATGYEGAPRGRKNCCDLKKCLREEMKLPSGQRYELCRSVHAEQNAIISAKRTDMLGSTLYLVRKDARTGEYIKNARPCLWCERIIINAGIKRVVIRRDSTHFEVVDVEKDFIENDSTLSL